MRKTKLNRLLSLIIAIAMLMPGAAVAASAADLAEDTPSPWAQEYVFMARAAYGLGNDGTYSNFRGNFIREQFYPVLASIQEIFGDDGGWSGQDEDAYITRGWVISALYCIISPVLEIPGGDALDYFVANGLIRGRADGDYQLDALCTVEEMIIFAVRAYEHIIYELGFDSKGFLFKAEGENNIVWLLGSIHLADGSLYPMSREILAAFESSAYLAVEVQIDDLPAADIQYMTMMQFITDGATIADKISPEVYEMYAAVYESFGVPQEIYDYIQPWAAMLELQNILMAMSGDQTELTDEVIENMMLMAMLGIDMYFLNRAADENKKIISLESVRSQVEMFASYSPELQELLLAGVLYEFMILLEMAEAPEDEEPEEILTASDALAYMLAMWKNGDEEAMLAFIGRDTEHDDPLMTEYGTKLWTERDIAMTEKIIIFLTEGADDYFVVVGAGHLIGEGSITDLLIKAGFEVERIR
jgi:hypothetical protein